MTSIEKRLFEKIAVSEWAFFRIERQGLQKILRISTQLLPLIQYLR
jgi:hypothetical protein